MIDLTWISPHFTRWDELLIPSEDKEGGWELRWDWRICDVDFLMEGVRRKELVKSGKLQLW
jgi:hypothetical protein